MKRNKCSDLYEIVKVIEEKSSKGKLNLEEIKKYMNDQMNIRLVPKDEVIASREKATAYVHYVISGSYFHYRISKSGKTNFLSNEKAPQWIGIDRAVDGQHANVTPDKVLKECTVLDIRNDYFERCIKEDGEFALYIIKNLLEKMAKISCKSDRVLFSNAKEHLMYYILEYWNTNHRNSEICRVDVKNEYIAEEIGVSTRTLYRVLNQLKEEEIIGVRRGDVVVNDRQIQKIKEFFSGFESDV